MKDYKRENPVVGAYFISRNESLFLIICFWKCLVNRAHTSLMFFFMDSA